ncbi:hypothetical protein ACFRCQ_22895 [Cytobacillus firmus]|uniref:hypothetical protein n=1 Tax=Cytobacillus firmus TaxID=1399 RepID=UPI0036C55B02
MKKVKKLVYLVTLITILTLPATSALAYYNHNYTYDFKYKLNSNKYLLTPDGAYIYMKNNSDGGGLGGAFYVDLYKAGGWGSTYIGTEYFPRDGSRSVKFEEGGWGDYWFSMRKTDDGWYVEGSGELSDH